MGVYGASVANNKPQTHPPSTGEVDPADGSTGGSGEEDAPAQPPTSQLISQFQQPTQPDIS